MHLIFSKTDNQLYVTAAFKELLPICADTQPNYLFDLLEDIIAATCTLAFGLFFKITLKIIMLTHISGKFFVTICFLCLKNLFSSQSAL